MPLLYYWERDQFLKDNAGKLIPGELTLSQGSEAFGRAETGERMWVFTRDCGHPARYVLAAQVIVDHIGEVGSPLGQYTAFARAGTTIRYRLVNPTVDVEDTIRGLSITTAGRVLGTNFTGHSAVRLITDADDTYLEAFAQSLKHATFGLRWLPDGCG